jgi:hypothetical protein
MKYPDFLSAMRLAAHGEELPVPKTPENLTFSDEKSNSLVDHRQHEGENVDCNQTFEVSCSSFEPHLFIQDGLNDLVNFVRDLNSSKKKSRTLRFHFSMVEFSTPRY